MNSFFGALQLLLIGLKLTETIDWSWWLVLTPFIMVVTIFFLIVAIPSAIILSSGKNKKNNKE